ncbi:WYL domain-containing protein [Gordonia sp. CPCC 206044]|uniref:helix-turn-helix transcriptional regulator n=1 Tax=Gordonia sp. CPCC 206044 TaxID=3140793 RepID=UPI003AF33932
MRAERLLAVLMLLKKHRRMTAAALAAELEVSERTILRDIDALSLSGVPVYAERGRKGGFALVPDYRTDLTGLTVDEATSLLAGTGRLDSPAFHSAMRKVAAALPEAHRSRAVRAAQRVLVRPEGFVSTPESLDALAPVQQAVFDGRRIRVMYRRRDGPERERVLDPVGLIVAGGAWYLVANSEGVERVYRVSRITDVEVMDTAADRLDEVDLEEVWTRHRERFRSSFESVEVLVECGAADVERVSTITALAAEAVLSVGSRRRVRLQFAGRRHAAGALWNVMVEVDATILEPSWLRDEVLQRAEAVRDRHRSV